MKGSLLESRLARFWKKKVNLVLIAIQFLDNKIKRGLRIEEKNITSFGKTFFCNTFLRRYFALHRQNAFLMFSGGIVSQFSFDCHTVFK